MDCGVQENAQIQLATVSIGQAAGGRGGGQNLMEASVWKKCVKVAVSILRLGQPRCGSVRPTGSSIIELFVSGQIGNGYDVTWQCAK
jgi:hypothetical protein